MSIKEEREAMDERIRELYRDHNKSEVARILGISIYRVDCALPRTKETVGCLAGMTGTRNRNLRARGLLPPVELKPLAVVLEELKGIP